MSLRDRAITQRTRVRYFTAVRRVLPLLCKHPTCIDETLQEWIEDQYTAGCNVSYVGDALSGLHHFAPWTKGKILGAWQLFRLWRRVERPSQAPPLPEMFLLAMVSRALELHCIDFAVTLALGFWALLRTGELMSLYPQHLLLGQRDLVIRLGLTKTGLRKGQDENVVISNKPTLMVVQTFLQIRKQQQRLHEPVYAAGAAVFRTEFKKALAFFNLADSFRPYSLRRGGATHDFRCHNSMERTLIKGRWGTSQAARQYIQEGLSVLTQISVSTKQQQTLEAYASVLAAQQIGPGKGTRKG